MKLTLAFGVLAAILAACAVRAPATTGGRPFAEIDAGNGSRIQLWVEAGPCAASAHRAVHVAKDGVITPGCWVTNGLAIYINWLDGDRSDVPAELVRRSFL